MPKAKKKSYKKMMEEILKPKTSETKKIVVGGGEFKKLDKI